MKFIPFSITLLVSLFAAMAQCETVSTQGQCHDQSPYQLKRQEMVVNGVAVKVYVYEGPLGRGMIHSNVDTAQAIEFVCLKTPMRWLAEDGRDD